MSAITGISDTFRPERWTAQPLGELQDMTYHLGDLPGGAQVARIAFDRPEVRNAFRPQTVDELYRCLDHARMNGNVAAILLTGNGPAADGGYAFCSGGDQRVRGRDGYCYAPPSGNPHAEAQNLVTPGEGGRDRAQAAGYGRLHILEVQRLIRATPKPVIALVPGWAAGGGHSLVMVCDLAIASAEHARFKQTDANVGSFDAGYGSALLARQVGDKRARQIFFLAQTYDGATAERWGVVNEVVPHAELEEAGWQWAATIAGKSPQAIRMLKYAFNLADDGLAGQQIFAGEATRMAYMTEEAQEGRNAFLERRQPDWSPYPYYY